MPHEVVTGVDERVHGGLHGSDEALAIAQRTLKEKTAKYLAAIEQGYYIWKLCLRDLE